ncbi:aldo/keto reductase [Nisaea acidiphila]|uniref:Aldo/keto reductase n=1 Tax=Nisaea acidiphila TaxID=1862145 RepID=A0A9J7ASF3_9PROT|nr:aldo/keto reductase [Nisaea acidiphila]UUX49794.1 aldo/keto reductase [Nisaea acidiphila]
MREISLPNGRKVPSLGLGTWHMGERGASRAEEARALRLGVELGMTLIDTAEMYANGGAEEVVGEAVRDCRAEVFIVSKVLPYNASRKGTIAACEASLKRLGTDHIDLYLLHWPGSHPLYETVEAFEELRAAGKIGGYGVSNFDTDAMNAWEQAAGAGNCQTDQVLYNLTRRGIEWDLVPWARNRAMPLMAYSPLEQGRLSAPELDDIGRKHGVSAAQVALSWVLRDQNIIAIPKASNPNHVRANRSAADLVLDSDDLARLDAVFPPPRGRSALEVL